MKKTIIFSLCILIGLALVSAAQQEVFVLNLKYDSGNISVQSFLKTTGAFYPPVSQPVIGYNLSVLTSDNKVLYSQLFDFSLEIYTSPPDPSWFDEQGNQIKFGDSEASQTIILNTSKIELLLPYYENADRIEIKNKSSILILTIPLNTDTSLEDIQTTTNSNTNTDTNTLKNSDSSCILVSCSYSPKSCPNWETQDKTCIDSCTNKTLKEKVKCTYNPTNVSNSNEGFWSRFVSWFSNLFRG